MSTNRNGRTFFDSIPIFRTENIDFENSNILAMVLAVCLLVTVYAQKLLRLAHIAVGENEIFIFLSCALAAFVIYSPTKTWYTMETAPEDLIALLLPLRILIAIFSVELHLLKQYLPQLILLNTLGMFLFVALFGAAASSYCYAHTTLPYILAFGTTMVSTDSDPLTRRIRDVEMSSADKALIIAECLTVYGHSIIILKLLIGYREGVLSRFYHLAFVHVRIGLGGLLLGCACGKLWTGVLNPLIHNPQYLILVWIITGYLLYIVCEGCLGVSGCFAVLAFAIFMSTEKNRISMRLFQKMEFIIDGWHFVLSAYVHLVTFSASFLYMTQTPWWRDIQYVPPCFIFAMISRLVVVLLIYACCFRRAMKKANIIMCLFLQRRGVIEVNKVRMLLHNPIMYDLAMVHNVATMIIVLEVVLRNVVLSLMFRAFGTNMINATRRANIASCLYLLESTKQSCLYMFQLDRHYGDADWKLIRTATNILDGIAKYTVDKNQHHYGCRPSCAECQERAGLELDSYQKAEKLKELKALVLRTQKVSFALQRERGLIMKADLKYLFNALDITALSNSLHIDVPELSRLYKRSHLQNLRKLLVSISTDATTEMQQKVAVGHTLARILLHPAYEIVMYLFIIFNVIIFYHNIFASCQWQLVILIPYCVFVTDAVLQFRLYMRLRDREAYNFCDSTWYQFDVFMLLVNTIDVAVVIFRWNCERYNVYGYAILIGFMFIGQLRLLKIIRLTHRLCKWVIKYCDSKIEAKIFTGYSRALSIIYSYHEVLHILPTLVQHAGLRQIMEKEIVKEKAIILAQLANVQYKFTRVAVNAKTQRIINTSIATMDETIVALKLMGFADESEYLDLVDRVQQLRKPAAKLTCMEVNSPTQILSWLPFFESMSGFDDLNKAAVRREYAPDELILVQGELSGGIYIVVEGLASMTITMDEAVRARMKQYGALPIKDYICDVDYYQASVHYVQAGNCLGILSFLTSRACDYGVRAVVPTKVYFLNADTLKKAMNDNSDPVHGLQCRLWKYVAVNLALSIMWKVPMYRNLRVEETYYYMEKSFVPNTSSKKGIFISDDVEDLLLVEGRIRDKISRKVYIAPCYVPRSVRRIQLIRNLKMLIEPQLFIIPLKPELHVRIYENFDEKRRTPVIFTEIPLISRPSFGELSGLRSRNYSPYFAYKSTDSEKLENENEKSAQSLKNQ